MAATIRSCIQRVNPKKSTLHPENEIPIQKNSFKLNDLIEFKTLQFDLAFAFSAPNNLALVKPETRKIRNQNRSFFMLATNQLHIKPSRFVVRIIST